MEVEVQVEKREEKGSSYKSEAGKSSPPRHTFSRTSIAQGI
jgi:hypothetical protein